MKKATQMNRRFRKPLVAAALSVLTLLLPSPAAAEMVLSKVILDLQAGKPAFDDIEVWNDSPERMYVLAEVAEIMSPGLASERRVRTPDPSVSGLLVTPQRLVLEPGQRRLVRVAAVASRPAVDRVYRVAIKPVAGPVSTEVSALKVFVGYDVLVLYRPAVATATISSSRAGRRLTLTNGGNTAVEVFEGRQCDAQGNSCRALKAARLYPGASLEQDLAFDTPAQFHVSDGRKIISRQF